MRRQGGWLGPLLGFGCCRGKGCLPVSRNVVAVVSSALFVALAALIIFVPVPYVTWRPGATIDVMGASDQGPLVEVVGYPGLETGGALYMTTISSTRVESSVSLPEALLAHLSEDADAMPRDVIYPPGKSQEQVRSDAVALMDSSREYAAVAALRAAGEAVTEVPMVTGVSATGPAADLLLPGDLIMSIDDRPVADRDAVAMAIRERSIGDPVVFRVTRDGQEETITVLTDSGSDAQPVVGVTVGVGFRYSPQVVFRVDQSVVGSSAGLVFSLAVYQKVTETDLLGDGVVAGTGTIDPSGKVGSVGGVREKIKGAEAVGASIFVMPETNCEALGNLETHVRVVPVPTLRDAISALQMLRSDPQSQGVPSCE